MFITQPITLQTNQYNSNIHSIVGTNAPQRLQIRPERNYPTRNSKYALFKHMVDCVMPSHHHDFGM